MSSSGIRNDSLSASTRRSDLAAVAAAGAGAAVAVAAVFTCDNAAKPHSTAKVHPSAGHLVIVPLPFDSGDGCACPARIARRGAGSPGGHSYTAERKGIFLSGHGWQTGQLAR